jgi:hypothetical protein
MDDEVIYEATKSGYYQNPSCVFVFDVHKGIMVTWNRRERFWVNQVTFENDGSHNVGPEMHTWVSGWDYSVTDAVSAMRLELMNPSFDSYRANGWQYLENGRWSPIPF